MGRNNFKIRSPLFVILEFITIFVKSEIYSGSKSLK